MSDRTASAAAPGGGAGLAQLTLLQRELLSRINQKDRFDFDQLYLETIDNLERRGLIESYKHPIISPVFGPCWRITDSGRAALGPGRAGEAE